MKKQIIPSLITMFLFNCLVSVAQTTIYEYNFNSGVADGWSLNASGSGQNQWVVNAEYAGLPGLVDDTPNQPGAIVASPNSSYLHIHNTTACSILNVCNASFDTGSASNRSAESPSINTTAYSDVSVSFYYLCAGAPGITYGVVEFSTDNGTSWTQSNSQLSGNPSTWLLATFTAPGMSGVANLKIRLRWVNGASGADPAFAIDDFEVSGNPDVVTNSIETINNVSPTNWCFSVSSPLTVNFNATGTYNAGNLFNVQLSDASGSFASPTLIGTLNSSASGPQTVTAYPTPPVGNGYLIRVVSTNPVTIGTATTSPLVVHPLPNVTLAPLDFVCLNHQPFTLSGGAPAGGGYSGPGVSNNVFTPSTAGLGTHTIVYSYEDGNNCSNLATQTILVASCAGVDDLSLDELIKVYPVPSNSMVYIETNEEIESLEILALSGAKVKELEPTQKFFTIQELNPGTYLLKINTSKGASIKQIVKI